MKKFRTVKDKKFKGMFRVKYPDGSISKDFYNLTRAKEHCAVLTEEGLECVY